MPAAPNDDKVPKKWRLVLVMLFASSGNKWMNPLGMVQGLGFNDSQSRTIMPKIVEAIRYSPGVFEYFHEEFPIPADQRLYRLTQKYIDNNPVIKAVIEDTE